MPSYSNNLPPKSDRGVNTVLEAKTEKTGYRGALFSSVDWLTVTTQKPSAGAAWARIFARIARENGEPFTQPWSFWGYEGWQTEHCRYGIRKEAQEYILIVSSYPADEVWLEVCPTARSITRIDLAVTISLDALTPGVPEAHYEALDSNTKKGARKYSLIKNTGGGQTLYVGSRHSDQFGRVYDKGAERGGVAGRVYRYEVVLRKDSAPELVKRLLVASCIAKDKSLLARKIRSFSWDWFDNREVTPLFQRGTESAIETGSRVRFTTIDRKLTWLSQSVSPTVRKLIAAGKTKEVLDALCLEAFMPDPVPEPGMADLG